MSPVTSEQLRTDVRHGDSPALPATHAGVFPADGITIDPLHRYAPLVGRILLAHIFLMSGAGKIMDWEGTQAHMAGRGMFWIPFFLVASIVFELAGGLSLVLGYKTRLGAAALLAFLIPVTFVFHNFWTYPEAQQQAQMINFMKNFAIMGGLLMVIGFGPGPISVDAKLRRSAQTHVIS